MARQAPDPRARAATGPLTSLGAEGLEGVPNAPPMLQQREVGGLLASNIGGRATGQHARELWSIMPLVPLPSATPHRLAVLLKAVSQLAIGDHARNDHPPPRAHELCAVQAV